MNPEPTADKTLRELHREAIKNCRHGHPPKTLEERKNRSKFVPHDLWFEYHIDKSGDCWIWTRGRYPNGYGKFHTPSGHVMTHRYAYQKWIGLIPEGMFVCHKCDNPPCCNPAHLFLGTALDNNRDTRAKGRWIVGNHSGMHNGGAKLQPQQVLAIRCSDAKTKTLMAEHGVSKSTIQKIRSGKTWTCL